MKNDNSENITMESNNLYDGVFDDIDKINKIIIGMISTGKFDTPYTYQFVSKSLKINKLTICLVTNNIKFSGNCYIEDGYAFINIDTGLILRHCDNDTIFDILNKFLESTIVHKLTHIKNDTEQASKNKGITTPYWYDVSTKYIFDNSNTIDIYYKFFYGLYISHYSENQAISSEIVDSVYNIIKYSNIWTKLSREDKIKKINLEIKNTQYYRYYTRILNFYVPLFNNFSREDIDKITSIFKENGYTISSSDIKKFISIIENGCRRALSKIKRGRNWLFNKFDLII